MKYGYARVSTTDQDLTIQKEALAAAGCEVIRGEQVSGTSRQGRTELANMMQFLRQGDQLVVTRVDRLARSMGDLQDIVRELRAKGCSLVMTEQQIDTSTPAGKAFLDMLGVFAEFETNLRAERQREGIEKAKAKGVYAGRRPLQNVGSKLEANKAAVLESVQADGKAETARKYGVNKMTLYRFLHKHAPNLVDTTIDTPNQRVTEAA